MTNVRPDLHSAIADLRLAAPVVVSRDATLREVAAAMEDHAVSCVLVGEEPTWVVTEHDLVGAVAAGMASTVPVREVTSRAPVWATPTTHVVDALAMMAEHRVRHLLVVGDDGRVHGVLALEQVAALLAG